MSEIAGEFPRPFHAWTESPMRHLGDAPAEYAQMRRVEVLGYDGDKHVTVRCEGETTTISRFYLYPKASSPYRDRPARTLREIGREVVSQSKLLRLRRQGRSLSARIRGRR